MCLVVFALRVHPVLPLVLAANRDEYYARPAAPATWGREPSFHGVLAGRDLSAGGTWFGVRRDGRFALVTNVRDGGPQDPGARSRGGLVPAVLGHDAPISALFAGLARDANRYNGFNLLAGDLDAAAWMSNRSPDIKEVTTGIHGLSNAALDAPWPKVVRTKARLAAWIERGDPDPEALFAALADRQRAPDAELPHTGVSQDWERVLSAPFIVSERYGTRCSTVYTVDRDGNARFHERTFQPGGAPGSEVIETFALG